MKVGRDTGVRGLGGPPENGLPTLQADAQGDHSKAAAKKPRRIANLLVVTMLLVGTLPLIISHVMIILSNRAMLATNQQQMHSQTCKSVANGVALFLHSCHSILDPLDKGLEIGFDPAKPNKVFYDTKTRDLLNTIFKSPFSRIVNIRTVYLDGRGVEAGYAIPKGSALEQELLQTFSRLSVGGAVPDYVSRPLLSEEFDVVFVMGAQVRCEGRTQGVVTAVFSLTEVFNMFTNNYMGNTVYLLDSLGNLILHPDQKIMKSRANLSYSPIFQEMRRLRTHAISTLSYTDNLSGQPVQVIGSVYMIPEASVDWGVVVQTSEAIANAEIRNMIVKTVIWILLSIISAVVMSYLFSLRISSPIRMLTMKTMAIMEGRFNERVDVASRNEVGILAQNFNHMAERIEAYIDQLKRAAQENHELFIGAIRTLAAAIDAKDPYTRGHSERVTWYSRTISQEMGLSPRETETVRIAALLHDVGKIGISDAVLQKPSMLTDDEYLYMKQHPEMGATIMSQIPQLRDVIPGMKFHHESLDGSGYPRGLKGDEIPIAARIIGVADAFDAMTTDRPYQKALPPEVAIEKILSAAGQKYDERVVAAFAVAWRAGKLRSDGRRVGAPHGPASASGSV